MERVDDPIVNIVNRFVKRHNISYPLDIEKLVEQYADIKKIVIPEDIDVDGVCLGIKKRDRPKIVLNIGRTSARNNFTLAHELGHIIIPWHSGMVIADNVDENQLFSAEFKYRELEGEANRFASELLMPEFLIKEMIESTPNLSHLHNKVVETCQVSFIAAALKIISLLPPDCAFCAVNESGICEYSSVSPKSMVSAQTKGAHMDYNKYPETDGYYHVSSGWLTYYWWKLKSKLKLVNGGTETWKEIRDKIITDINPIEGSLAFKRSLGGILGSAKDKIARRGDFTPETLSGALLLRFREKGLDKFVDHRDFNEFISKWALSIEERKHKI